MDTPRIQSLQRVMLIVLPLLAVTLLGARMLTGPPGRRASAQAQREQPHLQGPLMFASPFASGLLFSPLQPDLPGLLFRPDVQAEIRLTLQQKQSLQTRMQESQKSLGSLMQRAYQGSLQDQQALWAMSLEERQEQYRQMQARVEAIRTAWLKEVEDRIEKALKPQQYARLRELDLQKRGPLALGDPQVAGALNISPEHSKVIAEIGHEYQEDIGLIMREAFQQMRQGMERSGGLQPGRPPAFPDFASRNSPWRKKLEDVREDCGEQALDVLSATEEAAWRKALGAPFTFRWEASPPPGSGRSFGKP